MALVQKHENIPVAECESTLNIPNSISDMVRRCEIFPQVKVQEVDLFLQEYRNRGCVFTSWMLTLNVDTANFLLHRA